MEKSPDDRYQSMEQVLADLAKLKQGISIGKLKLAREEQSQKAHKSTVVLFVVGFLLAYLVTTFVQSALDRAIPSGSSTVGGASKFAPSDKKATELYK
jgi:hypothetical protein